MTPAEFDEAEFDAPSTPEAGTPEPSVASAQEPAATLGVPGANLENAPGHVVVQGADQGSEQPVLDLDMAPPTPAGFNGDIQL